MYLFVLLSALLVILPEDLDTLFSDLKKATTANDPVQVKKLAAQAHALATEAIAEPASNEGAEHRIAFAKDVDLYTEYALSATALRSTAAASVELLAQLEQQNPKSKYLDGAYGKYLAALQQSGSGSRIPVVAEKAIANFPDNEDLLLVLADSAYAKKQSDKALRYAERLTTVMNRHPRQEGVSAPDWERKKATAFARGYWIAGLVYSEKTQYFKANQNLRAALPYIQGQDELMAPALFYLGVANYQLGAQTRNKAQILEGAQFSDQAAKLPGALAQQAWRNAQVMRTEAAKLR